MTAAGQPIGAGRGGLVARIAERTTGRDRVVDAAKSTALLLVVVGHSIAFHVTADGRAVNVLEVQPALVPLTWLFQVLPVFFAVGAVSSAASLGRHGSTAFLDLRMRRLLTPVVVYAGFWTFALLPLTLMGDAVVGVGQFLAQLLWFAGVYLIVVTAVPLTAPWAARPVPTLALWLAVIAGVDAARMAGAPEWLGWANLVLVWGWLHQLGYSLPALRMRGRQSPVLLAATAAGALAGAVALALAGPYSSSLVSYAGDPELSNLAPPSLVLLLYGVAQVLGLAVLWPAAAQLLARDAVWAPVALVGGRAMEIYLWHIPLVGLAAGAALALQMSPMPLSLPWWLLHGAVIAAVIPAAWLVAGAADLAGSRLQRIPRLFGVNPAVVGVVGGALVLNISVTGFATWSGAGALGLPSAALVNLLLLLLLWQTTGPPRPRH